VTTWGTTLGDCSELLEAMDSATIDAVICDPPYGTASESKRQKRGSSTVAFDYGWDQDLPLAWISEAARVMKPGASLVAFTDTKRVTDLWRAIADAGVRPLQVAYWIKSNPTPNPRKNFTSAVEAMIFARKRGKVIHWGGGGATPNLFECPSIGAESTGHPAEKPLKVMQWIVRLVAPVGGVVLDPFMGSGSTGVAALRLGRSFVGHEIDPEFYAIAKRRLQAEDGSEPLIERARASQGELL